MDPIEEFAAAEQQNAAEAERRQRQAEETYRRILASPNTADRETISEVARVLGLTGDDMKRHRDAMAKRRELEAATHTSTQRDAVMEAAAKAHATVFEETKQRTKAAFALVVDAIDDPRRLDRLFEEALDWSEAAAAESLSRWKAGQTQKIRAANDTRDNAIAESEDAGQELAKLRSEVPIIFGDGDAQAENASGVRRRERQLV